MKHTASTQHPCTQSYVRCGDTTQEENNKLKRDRAKKEQSGQVKKYEKFTQSALKSKLKRKEAIVKRKAYQKFQSEKSNTKSVPEE